jgi:hypothetical protein
MAAFGISLSHAPGLVGGAIWWDVRMVKMAAFGMDE